MNVKQVQRWVITALIITTAIHFVGGLLLMADYLGTADGFWVLTIVSTAVMTLSIAGSLLLHQKKVLSPWLVFGILPLFISLIWIK